jgi:3-deoxy-7-phosphoheptulonate synthase
MNFVRALIDGGFADLHHPEYWDLGLGRAFAAQGATTERIVAAIADHWRFIETSAAGECTRQFH